MSSTATLSLILGIFALFASITFHEFFHAWVADFLGDPTPRSAGRLSLNPVAHVDLFGTILLPLFLMLIGARPFGWAKPVPINPNNFKNYRVGELLTSIAGPAANLILVLVFAFLYRALPTKESIFAAFVLNMIVVNLILMLFNLIPIPPLDGSKVLFAFLPLSWVEKLEIYGPFLLIPVIFIFGPAIISPAVNFFLNLLGVSLNLF